MANEACTFSQLLRVGGKRSNWYSGKVYSGISVGKNDVSLASSVFDSSGKILAYRALGDDLCQNGEDLNGILEGSSSGTMGANLSVEGLLAVGFMLVSRYLPLRVKGVL